MAQRQRIRCEDVGWWRRIALASQDVENDWQNGARSDPMEPPGPLIPLSLLVQNDGSKAAPDYPKGNVVPNMGRPLTDASFVASSSMTSQCSASWPFSRRTISTMIQFAGRPMPENRPWSNT